MFNVLIDTSVWLELAENQKQTPLLAVVEQMVKEGLLTLLVPRVVLDEFHKNRDRVAKTSARSLASHFKEVREAVGKAAGDKKRTELVLAHLADANHRVPIIGGAAAGTLERIDKLLHASTIIEASARVMLRAAERALKRKAPCHHENKNSIADAVLIETYIELSKSKESRGQRYAFVTHNKHDFSQATGSHKLPHADLSSSFSRIKSMYFINLAECLRRVDPSTVTHIMWEHSWEQEPRGLSELLKAENLLFHQVWYNRHMNLQWAVQKGRHKIVSREEWENGKLSGQTHTIEDVWKGALNTALNTEKRYGKRNLGPWDDFEWGMINGKLSAIRWMLGDEWDMLDT